MGIILYTTLAASVTSICYLKLWIYSYWNRIGLPSINTSLPFAQANSLLFKRRTVAEEFQNVYQNLKNNKNRHGGTYMFTTPIYVPIDPEIINYVLNDSKFQSRDIYFNKNKDKLFNSLYYSDNLQSCEKYRLFFKQIFNKPGTDLFIENNTTSINEWFNNFPAESSIDCLDFFQNLQAYIMKNIFFTHDKNLDLNRLRNKLECFSKPEENTSLKFLLGLVNSKILKYFCARVSNKKSLTFIVEEIKKEMKYRINNNIEINDFLNSVTSISETDESKIQLVITMILNNFKTISPVLIFCLYELQKNPNVYLKLKKEIDEFSIEGKITNKSLENLTYLDQVIKETLRKYPVVPIIKRTNIKNVAVPNSAICLEENTNIIISTFGIQNDSEYFPQPELFQPERFNNDVKNCTFIPFGGGSKNCIGQEIAIIQIKLILLLFLKNFNYNLDVGDDLSFQNCKFYLKPESVKININRHKM